MAKPDLEEILREALQDERKAEAVYCAIIDKFGPIRPFINIVSAENRHAMAIENQMSRLGFKIPANEWEGRGEAPETIAAACKQAIDGEIDNIALYDRLIPQIDDPAVQHVLQRLSDASRRNHLPAFRRCLQRQA